MLKFLLLIFLIFKTTLFTYAQFSFKTEYIGKSAYRDDDTDQKVENYKGSSILYQADLSIPLSVQVNKNGLPRMWSVDLSMTYVNLNNYNFQDNLVGDEIFNSYLGVSNVIPLSKKWMIATSLGIGIYSPTTQISKITNKQILGNMAALFICNIRPNLQLGFGLAFNNTFGYPMVFPALYLEWNTEGKWIAHINMTDGFVSSFGYQFNKFFSLNVAWEVTGQMSFVEKDHKDMMFSQTHMIAGIRPEFKLGEKLTIPVTLGINTMRFAGYEKRTLKAMFAGTEPGGWFDVAPYLSTGFSVQF